MSIPTIYQTDLFHFHADPDDHWDLACQFALAYMELIDLKGVLIDFPPYNLGEWAFDGDPSIQAVNQMNYITGLSVPVGVGASREQVSRTALKEGSNISGINMVLKVLRDSPQPVAIHIVGSCRDIAIAGTMEPELFKDKCRAIYLNAGSGTNKSVLEYNVSLDPLSYSAIFSLHCPIYWLLCFHDMEAIFTYGTHGTFYKFMQGDVLPDLSDNVQKYIAYALGKNENHRWLKYLLADKDQELIDNICKSYRFMWSTAGFLHNAGMTVSMNGDIIPLTGSASEPVYSFEKITVKCAPDGRTEWSFSSDNEPMNTDLPERYIFKINDLDKYEAAMTRALKALLANLP